MKDNFSHNSNDYALFRPGYPDALFEYLALHTQALQHAWDCGTGNGQVAKKLSPLFEKVYATDISQPQLDRAVQLPNIDYSLQAAENTDFPDDFFDMIVVAQAIHWFDFDGFYSEVRRTAKKDAILVVLGYGLFKVSPEIDPIIQHFYQDILGNYWDPERRYIDEGYLTIPFPFEEIPSPTFKNTYSWTLKHLVNYLSTWSAVRHYEKKNRHSPLPLLIGNLKSSWNEKSSKDVKFPLLLRIGKIHF